MSQSSLLSASKLPRVLACPASHVLPQQDSSPSYEATRGINLHTFLEIAQSIGAEAGLQTLAPGAAGRDTASLIDLKLLWEDLADIAPEIAFAFQPATQRARLLGTELQRRYLEVESGELFGTADLIARQRGTGLLVVADYKTGAQPVSAKESRQMAFLALCAQLHYGAGECLARVIHIQEDGTFYANEHLYTAAELRVVAEELSELQQVLGILAKWQAAGKALPVAIGEHCRYCPASAACPASAPVISRLSWQAGDAEELLPEVAELGAEQAGALWERLQVVEKSVETYKAALKEYARTRPLALAGGKRLMLGTQTAAQIALVRGLEVVGRVCGRELAEHLLGSTNARLAKSELEAALKASGLKGGELKQVLTVLNQEFAAHGALSEQVREVMQPAEKVLKARGES